MAAISGIHAKIAKDSAAIHNVGKWSIDPTVDLKQFASTATVDGHGAVQGIVDWTGSYEGYGHTPVVLPGDSFVFHGSLDGTNGYSGTAMVSEVEIVINVESGEIMKHTVSFAANGALTKGAEAAQADATVPNPVSSLVTGVKLRLIEVEVGSPTTLDVPDVRTITIKLSCDLKEYSGTSCVGFKKRVAGRKNCEVSAECYFSDPTALPPGNSVRQCRVFVSATEYWDFKWLRMQEPSGVEADIETGNLVGATLMGVMQLAANVGAPPGTPTAGYVKTPATTTWAGA